MCGRARLFARTVLVATKARASLSYMRRLREDQQIADGKDSGVHHGMAYPARNQVATSVIDAGPDHTDTFGPEFWSIGFYRMKKIFKFLQSDHTCHSQGSQFLNPSRIR